MRKLDEPRPAEAIRRRNPVVRTLASIRFGISVLVLILLYASIGSALAPVRGALEMTEMQVFQHWLFLLLLALFTASLVTATVTRIRFNVINAGVLTVHTGLLVLIGGAVWYFSSKVEGDVILFSPRIELLTADGRALPNANFLAETGQFWEQFMPAFGGAVRFVVLEAGGHGNEPVTAARVQATFGSLQPKVVKLTANAAEQTSLGNGLALRLRTFPPQSEFYVHDRPALYYGRSGETTRHVAELTGLPLHRERYLPGEGPLRDTVGQIVESKRTRPYITIPGWRIRTGWFEPWRLPIPLNAPELPFDVEVTGYVPYIAGFRVAATEPTGESVLEPVIQPLALRRPNMDRDPSAIRVRLTGRGSFAGWSASRWCAFNPYPRLDDVHATQMANGPLIVALPDGSRYDLIYSRLARDLGSVLTSGRLRVNLFPGGRNAESWQSEFFVTSSGRAEPAPALVKTNQTYRVAGWTLFQSGAAGDHWSYTILGIGNRHGIVPMAAGCALIALGCLYAFYVKPVLKRRAAGTAIQTESGRSRRAARQPAANPEMAEVRP